MKMMRNEYNLMNIDDLLLFCKYEVYDITVMIYLEYGNFSGLKFVACYDEILVVTEKDFKGNKGKFLRPILIKKVI